MDQFRVNGASDGPVSCNGNKATIYPSGSTIFTATVLDAQDCVSFPATDSVTVSPCTEIPDEENGLVAFFPNPFCDHLDIIARNATLITVTDALQGIVGHETGFRDCITC